MKEGTKPAETEISQGVLNPISIAVLVLLIGLIALVPFKDELQSQKNIIPHFVAIIGVILAISIATSIMWISEQRLRLTPILPRW